MTRRKAAGVMLLQSLFCASVIGLQFWIYGFSMIMSHSDSVFIGNLDLAFLRNTLGYSSQANSAIPDILLAAFHFTFVTATSMILAGAMLERGRLFPTMMFLFCWTTFVYYFLAYWEWNPNGWLYNLGVYDFAGSGPVHIAAGFGALAWSVMLGKRNDPYGESLGGRIPHFRPHNPFMFTLGTCLIWFGWFAFNGGSTANLSIRSIYVVVNTNLAAMGGATTWAVLDYMYTGRFSLVGTCSGVISGNSIIL
jgi:Amt family ammonium transporter